MYECMCVCMDVYINVYTHTKRSGETAKCLQTSGAHECKGTHLCERNVVSVCVCV